ncbi:RNA polymerase sigma factor [Algoriphagus sp.]|uniref:RNA polymerase sigma factor n=1 Tax=Algoriphagus sp. TaxID=1872435 RepID=UPI00391D6D5D
MKVPKDIWKENPEILLSKAYEDNFEWCVSYVRKNSGTADNAADIFQESISIAWINLKEGKFQGDSENFNAYIRQVCKFKWINQLRSISNNKIILKEDLSDFEGKTDLDSVEQDSSQIDLLHASFSSIGEKCRDLLDKFYFKRESLATIAQQHNATEASVKTIKYRCMVRLRKAYLELSKGNE